VHLLEWEIPLAKESLDDYAKRIAKKKRENLVIGVSFGGILFRNGKTYQYQKSNHHLECKSNLEFPRRMKIAKTTKAYKLIPMSLILNLRI
jgi:hypothetical protein